MPSLKDSELNSVSDSIAANSSAENASVPQPVALEAPVTVKGARSLEGSDKREPFSESTKTVLVFGNGAVLRLGSTLAPGQLLFVTNERTKKEVTCQVVRSKAGKGSGGYVEVEFTEPVSGFWGLRFPTDHAALRTRTSLSDPESESDEFLRSALETSATLTRKLDSGRADASGAVRDGFKANFQSEDRASNRAELLTEGPAGAPKVQASPLQEQFSALLSTEQRASLTDRISPATPSPASKAPSDTTAKPLEKVEAKPLAKRTEPVSMSEFPPANAGSTPLNAFSGKKSALPADESSVPSWLQPLTRLTSPSAPNEEAAPEIASSSEQKIAAVDKQAAQSTPSKASLVVGNSLLGQNPAPAASRHGRKGLMIGIAAALVVAAAGATWYLQQPSGSALATQKNRATQAPATPAPPAVPSMGATSPTDATAASPQQGDSQQVPADTTIRVVADPLPAKPTSGVVPENASTSPSARVAQESAVISERIPKSNPAFPPSTPSPRGAAESVEPEAKKAGLGDVPLGKPKAKRRTQSAALAAPTLSQTAAQAVPPGASLGAGLVPDAAQPSAPATATPVGGDVKPARLLSSVQPVYPAVAKSQHLAGDVRIDALIDANGRVSSMKVISGPAMLHQAAMDALRQWKYQAATLNGTAVPMHLTVTLQFHLQ
jgi:TonB family protein